MAAAVVVDQIGIIGHSPRHKNQERGRKGRLLKEREMVVAGKKE